MLDPHGDRRNVQGVPELIDIWSKLFKYSLTVSDAKIDHFSSVCPGDLNKLHLITLTVYSKTLTSQITNTQKQVLPYVNIRYYKLV